MTVNFSEALPKALLSDQVYAMVRGLVLDGTLGQGGRGVPPACVGRRGYVRTGTCGSVGKGNGGEAA